MEVSYRNVTFREADGGLVTRRIPTVQIPDAFSNKAQAEWLREHDPAGYLEYMHEVDEAFIAQYFGG